jgi:hypothetical protein
MTNIKSKTTKNKINSELYVNKETGESLSDEMPGISSVMRVDKEHVVMHSEHYIILDSNAMVYLRENFSPVDLGRIMQMTDMTKGEYNILYDGPTPHSDVSLMKVLVYSRNKFANFMTRLEKKSIIYYVLGYTDGKRVKYTMLNPHLARKRKTIHRDCFTKFDDIRTKKMIDHVSEEG